MKRALAGFAFPLMNRLGINSLFAPFFGGTGSILGSMIGALIMAVLRNGTNQMGWPTYMQEIIIGAVIVLAVALDRLRQSTSRQ